MEPVLEEYVHVSGPEIHEEEVLNPNPSEDSDASERDFSGDEVCRGSDSAEASVEGGLEGKRVLPDELSKGVVFLECESSAEGGSCDVYLVGTAHISQNKVDLIQGSAAIKSA